MMATMDALEFAKGHGTGNDFVIIPDPDGLLNLPPELVAALCDRRFGIGGDGLLRVVRTAALPGTAHRAGEAEWFMDYRNADGSLAETCGNGVRVFARYLVERGLATGPDLAVATRAGQVAATVTDQEVTVSTARPRVLGRGVARLGGRELAGDAVDCGNPHLVCPLPDGLDLAGLDLGEPPGLDPELFPHGANVELTVAAPPAAGHSRLRMRVHERGVGETLSCGSGACAAAAAALHRAGTDRGVVVVDVPGGTLRVTLTDQACTLAGPAVLVGEGAVALDAIARQALPAAPPGPGR
jgi:diaminopimelate epimerase